MNIFDGKKHSEKLEKSIEDYIQTLAEVPTLSIISFGYNESSEKYILLKERLCHKLGIPVELHSFDTHNANAIKEVEHILHRPEIGGAIVQLPVPKGMFDNVLDLIPLNKDIDLLSSSAQLNFYAGDFTRKMPVLRAVEYFIKSNNLSLLDLEVSIVGEGFLVGRPLAHYLNTMGAKVNVVSSYSRGQKLAGQLIVLSVGSARLVDGADIPHGAAVIDFGSSVVEGKTVGDLDMESKIEHIGTLSPSPGGMGPLVVRFLVMNHLGL